MPNYNAELKGDIVYGNKEGDCFLFVCMIGLYIFGCGKISSTFFCTLYVVASYSGYGEDGQNYAYRIRFTENNE